MGFDLTKLHFDSSDIANSCVVGSYITDGTEVASVNASNELQVRDDDAITLLTTIDADTSAMVVYLAAIEVLLTSIDTDTAAMAVDLAAIEVLLASIDADTAAMVVDLAAIEVLLTSIDSDTAAMVVDLAAIEVLLTSIDADTSTIAGDTTSIDSILTALSKAEDAAHGSGDQGIQLLAVRNDVEGTLCDTDGDYAPLQVDNVGRLRVIGDLDVVGNVGDDDADSGNPMKVGSRGVDGLLTALSASNDRADLLSDLYRRIWVNNAPNVGNTLSKPTISDAAAEIAAAPQAGRTRIIVQNLSSKPIYLGKDNTVTTSTGIKLEKNVIMELPYGEDLNLWAISDAGISSDVRVLELA